MSLHGKLTPRLTLPSVTSSQATHIIHSLLHCTRRGPDSVPAHHHRLSHAALVHLWPSSLEFCESVAAGHVVRNAAVRVVANPSGLPGSPSVPVSRAPTAPRASCRVGQRSSTIHFLRPRMHSIPASLAGARALAAVAGRPGKSSSRPHHPGGRTPCRCLLRLPPLPYATASRDGAA